MQTVNLMVLTEAGNSELNGISPMGWEVLDKVRNPKFSDKEGLWLLISRGNKTMWVHATEDINYRIIYKDIN